MESLPIIRQAVQDAIAVGIKAILHIKTENVIWKMRRIDDDFPVGQCLRTDAQQKQQKRWKQLELLFHGCFPFLIRYRR